MAAPQLLATPLLLFLGIWLPLAPAELLSGFANVDSSSVEDTIPQGCSSTKSLDGLQFRVSCPFVPYASIRDSIPAQVTHLSILHSDLMTLNFAEFKLPQLEQLILTNNNISTIVSSVKLTGDYMHSLRNLFMGSNRVTSLPDRAFEVAPNLERLLLQRNGLRELTSSSLDGLEQLKGLVLSENSLSSLPCGFMSDLVSLRYARVNQNALAILQTCYFDGNLQNLETLDLSSNQIKYLAPGVFANLQPLKKLLLQDNEIPALDGLVLNGLSKLETLTLGNNKLLTLQDSFLHTPQLQKLVLSENPVKTIQSETFRGLSHLKELYLRDMSVLTAVQPGAFSGLYSLQKLAMEGCVQLETLDGHVTSLEGASLDLSKLRELFLSGCGLKTLDEGLFLNLPALQVATVNDNPISCDCNTAWVVQELQSSSSVHQWAEAWKKPYFAPTCASPAAFAERDLASLSPEDVRMLCSVHDEELSLHPALQKEELTNHVMLAADEPQERDDGNNETGNRLVGSGEETIEDVPTSSGQHSGTVVAFAVTGCLVLGIAILVAGAAIYRAFFRKPAYQKLIEMELDRVKYGAVEQNSDWEMLDSL